MTDAELEAMVALGEGITPGPWDFERVLNEQDLPRPWVGNLATSSYAALACGNDASQATANARAIAAYGLNPLRGFRGVASLSQRRSEMDKQTALGFIDRIESHREKEAAIWKEMRDRDDYEMHEDNSIKSILEERRRARELMESADASLDAFDWVDDGTGNFVPREEVETA